MTQHNFPTQMSGTFNCSEKANSWENEYYELLAEQQEHEVVLVPSQIDAGEDTE